jgi:hypothetical protein
MSSWLARQTSMVNKIRSCSKSLDNNASSESEGEDEKVGPSRSSRITIVIITIIVMAVSELQCREIYTHFIVACFFSAHKENIGDENA